MYQLDYIVNNRLRRKRDKKDGISSNPVNVLGDYLGMISFDSDIVDKIATTLDNIESDNYTIEDISYIMRVAHYFPNYMKMCDCLIGAILTSSYDRVRRVKDEVEEQVDVDTKCMRLLSSVIRSDFLDSYSREDFMESKEKLGKLNPKRKIAKRTLRNSYYEFLDYYYHLVHVDYDVDVTEHSKKLDEEINLLEGKLVRYLISKSISLEVLDRLRKDNKSLIHKKRFLAKLKEMTDIMPEATGSLYYESGSATIYIKDDNSFVYQKK